MNRAELLRAFATERWAIMPQALAELRSRLLHAPEGNVDEWAAQVAATERDGLLGLSSVTSAQAALEAATPTARQGGSVAVLPVRGIISQRASFWSMLFGGSSTEDIGARLRQYVADDTVSGIVLDIDSPGGTVSGVPELADLIYAARDVKPIVAISNSLMASAAYWIGSQASEVIAAPSSELGSIGVFAEHQDWSAALDAMGIKITLVSAGKYKTEGNMYQPLDPEAQAALQQAVDDFYAMFVVDVARGRGVKAADVRSGFGEGRVVTAKDAVKLGMADRIGLLSDATNRAMGRRTLRGEADARFIAGALPVHHGATDDGTWDAAAEEASIPNDEGEATFRKMYGWRDDAADPDTKSAYKYLHHFWNDKPGAASTRACSSGIGALNGGRGGSGIPDGDRSGVHSHLAAHLKDAGQEAPPLSRSNESYKALARALRQ